MCDRDYIDHEAERAAAEERRAHERARIARALERAGAGASDHIISLVEAATWDYYHAPDRSDGWRIVGELLARRGILDRADALPIARVIAGEIGWRERADEAAAEIISAAAEAATVIRT